MIEVNVVNFPKYFTFLKECSKKIMEQSIYSEKHHIIPKALGGNNEKTNLIILTAKDHIIAHFLLWKEGLKFNNIQFEIKTFFPVNLMLQLNSKQKQFLQYQDYRELEYIFEIYNNKREYFASLISVINKGNPGGKGRKWIHKDKITKYCLLSELGDYLNTGWVIGKYISEKEHKNLSERATRIHKNKIVSNDTGKKISDIKKGMIGINKEGINKRVIPEKLNVYLEDGWILGNSVELSSKVGMEKGRIVMNSGIDTKYIKEDELSFYIESGWGFGFCRRETNKGKIHIYKNNTEIVISKDEFKKYAEEGWIKGTLRGKK